MPWTAGDTVIVKPLGKKQGAIVEAGASGRYRVRVEGVTMWCREEDLAAADGEKKRKKARGRGEHGTPNRGAHGALGGQVGHRSRLDLHGLRVEEALALVDEEINRSLLRDADALEIVHGRGTGRIRSALHRHLASMKVVAAFRLDSSNPGVTWVYF
jgi:DNA mismatch repair protein MutS2